MAVVGDDRILLRGEIVALVDADQQFIFTQADIISILERVVMVFAERYLRAVDVRSVGAGVDKNVGSGPKIDACVFPRQIPFRVG